MSSIEKKTNEESPAHEKRTKTICSYTDEQIQEFKDNLVASNTKKSTASSVQRLKAWYEEKHYKELALDEISKVEAPQLLKHFFLEIRQTTKGNEGKEYEPGTLQTYRNGLRRYFIERPCPPAPDNFDIDAVEFEELAKILSLKKKDLKKQGLGNNSNAADSLTPEEVEQMWSSGAIGLSNPRSLQYLVWWNNMVHLGMRAIKEHYDCRVEDFIITDDYIQYNERQTKNRQGDAGIKKQRKYNNKLWRTDGGERDPHRAFKKYIEHLPVGENVPNNLYLTVVKSPKSSVWFIPVGVNTLSKFMQNIASIAKLPENKKFTNSSGRKTAIQFLRDDFSPLEISELTGHSNPDSISSYSHNPMEKQRKMSHKLSGFSGNSSATTSTANNILQVQQTTANIQDNYSQVVANKAMTLPGFQVGPPTGMFTGATFNAQVNISINMQANNNHESNNNNKENN